MPVVLIIPVFEVAKNIKCLTSDCFTDTVFTAGETYVILLKPENT